MKDTHYNVSIKKIKNININLISIFFNNYNSAIHFGASPTQKIKTTLAIKWPVIPQACSAPASPRHWGWAILQSRRNFPFPLAHFCQACRVWAAEGVQAVDVTDTGSCRKLPVIHTVCIKIERYRIFHDKIMEFYFFLIFPLTCMYITYFSVLQNVSISYDSQCETRNLASPMGNYLE